MSVIVQYKIETWEELVIDDMTTEEVVNHFSNGHTLSELFEKSENFTIENINDTDKLIEPSKNHGHATIQIFKEGEPTKPLWENGKGYFYIKDEEE